MRDMYRWGIADPDDIEKFFSTEDGLGSIETFSTKIPSKADEKMLQAIREALPYIPKKEADCIELYYLRQMNQVSIAHLFDVSQPTVCYRIRRATERVKHYMNMPKVEDGLFESDMIAIFKDEIDLAVILATKKYMCQSDVSRAIGVSQGFVRHRFFKCLIRLEEISDQDLIREDLEKVEAEYMSAITPNEKFAKLKEMKRVKLDLAESRKGIPKNLVDCPLFLERTKEYAELFQYIASNFTILRSVGLDEEPPDRVLL